MRNDKEQAVWFKCEDAMPEIPENQRISDDVLAIDDSGRMHVAYAKRDHIYGGIVWMDAGALGYIYPEKITHWMPLPEPPKEDE